MKLISKTNTINMIIVLCLSIFFIYMGSGMRGLFIAFELIAIVYFIALTIKRIKIFIHYFKN